MKTPRRILVRVLASACVLLLFGACAGPTAPSGARDPSTVAPAVAPAQIAGSWSGTITITSAIPPAVADPGSDSAFGCPCVTTKQIVLTLDQSGRVISGTYLIGSGNFTVRGTVVGDMVGTGFSGTLRCEGGGCEAAYVGTANPATLHWTTKQLLYSATIDASRN